MQHIFDPDNMALVAIIVVVAGIMIYTSDPWAINRELNRLERRLAEFPADLEISMLTGKSNAASLARSYFSIAREAVAEGRTYTPWYNLHMANNLLDLAVAQQQERKGGAQ